MYNRAMGTHSMWWKNKKLLAIVYMVTAIAIVLVGVFLFMRAQSDDDHSLSPINTDEARALSRGEQCLTNNASLKAQVEAQRGLGEDDGLWTSYIYDVPAGTNVDVNIATYTENNKITGSLIYSKPYGSYNFTLTKKSDAWSYSKFTGCK